MSKFIEIDKDIVDMFDEKFSQNDLEQVMRLKVIGVQKQKEVVEPKKASDIVRHLNSIDVFMFVNEGVFNELEEVSKHILIEEAIARVDFNHEKEMIKINKGDIHTPSLFLRKHGLEQYEAVRANVQQVMENKKQEDKE